MSLPDLRIGELDRFRILNQSLKDACNVGKCETPAQLYDALTAPPRPQAILVFEPDVIQRREYDHLTNVLADYTKTGGRVLIGGLCSSLTTAPKLNAFFQKKFGVPWTLGSYFQANYSRNRSHRGVGKASFKRLPSSLTIEALHLQNVEEGDVLYTLSSSSLVVGPSEAAGAPVAMRRVGKGWVGWHGDVNHGQETTLVHLAMLGVPITEPMERNILGLPEKPKSRSSLPRREESTDLTEV